ncbi:NUF1 protein (Spindle poly body spacer protein SPC110) [Scheffersomyces stipitis CBS 6054]|uniref:NUF1 protein (Spindle poly body spacer protein SPC110) n=1 Tax=Scheffersomyces stipitis (strain ATCC 58785 / CBS 6054 / NBRC 10063 / NRRL Y-11545) TaxID=322104 RepID=A3GI82_PICST|nr:NUF1 protein (Spindle poly body spacer protein SPC110) [Scheffersomyces stipitis CBS 6054]EAZ63188.2 NUF1 protein (Spindle poly body spacer protein SPC110) [Scheffersomyces stipitis CBS 6054]KAG2735715.1 hypothetical protein G9P44_001929 [Scheffersomyces stipitis]
MDTIEKPELQPISGAFEESTGPTFSEENESLPDFGNIESNELENEKNSESPEPQENQKPQEQQSKLDREETIIRRLRDIPLDKLKEILTNQLDLEIRLKHHELKLSEAELSKIESQMIVLRKFFEIPNEVKIEGEPSEFTLKYFDILNKSLNVTYNDLKKQQSLVNVDSTAFGLFKPDYMGDKSDVFSGDLASGGHSYRTRSTTSSLRPTQTYTGASAPGNYSSVKFNQNLGCLYRRTDGIIVKLTCPDCQRSNFSSAQGFLNHSRIAHSKEYTSQDAAALKCGEIIPEVKQDAEGELSLSKLKEKGIDPNKNLNVNEIYFNGLSNSLNTVHNSAQSSSRKNSSPSSSNECAKAAEETSSICNEIARSVSVESLATSATPEAVPQQNSKNQAESELLKKLIKEGKMKKEDFEQFVSETRKPVANSHLFENEVEEENDSETSAVSTPAVTNSRTKMKRRQSRGGINISITRGDSGLEIEDVDEDDFDENTENKEPTDKKDTKRRRKS